VVFPNGVKTNTFKGKTKKKNLVPAEDGKLEVETIKKTAEGKGVGVVWGAAEKIKKYSGKRKKSRTQCFPGGKERRVGKTPNTLEERKKMGLNR